ncbi:anti-sigma factor [Paenibacillus puerhi]|uniref:anti-sigma factor n=1 Tax=Paenibacillus puerhi TaxID=2692622 RepID=UPI0013594857|nr:anti-sigma factor [Paenibacillus puerhi]
MSEEFKAKLKQYVQGTLSGPDKEEMERELEKMEAYQGYLDELLTEGDLQRKRQDSGQDDSLILGAARTQEHRIIRKGKWKARLTNTLSVLILGLAITVVSSIVTGVFYGLGEPTRTSLYRDAVASAIAVSRPNISAELNGQGIAFFTMDLSGSLVKQIGDERVGVGHMSTRFLMNVASMPQISWQDNGSGGSSLFFRFDKTFPLAEGQEASQTPGRQDEEEWSTLEKLPEGTVAEAFISLDRFWTTDDLLQQLEHKNLQPLWFAADTGLESEREDHGIVLTPLGFPYWPMWRAEDLSIQHYSEEKTGWFSKVVSSGGMYPTVKAYGDGELREQNFLKTLQFLQEYKSITRKVAPFLKIDESVAYIEKNGVKLYGLVVTGPVKELLKLKQESWVKNLQVGDVRLWNWRDRS